MPDAELEAGDRDKNFLLSSWSSRQVKGKQKNDIRGKWHCVRAWGLRAGALCWDCLGWKGTSPPACCLLPEASYFVSLAMALSVKWVHPAPASQGKSDAAWEALKAGADPEWVLPKYSCMEYVRLDFISTADVMKRVSYKPTSGRISQGY